MDLVQNFAWLSFFTPLGWIQIQTKTLHKGFRKCDYSTTIMLVLTAQLCLYTLQESSLDGIPKTGYVKFIDYWNMFTTTITLSNFFTLFLWEVLQCKGRIYKFKMIARILIPLITVIGVITYLILAAWLYFHNAHCNGEKHHVQL